MDFKSINNNQFVYLVHTLVTKFELCRGKYIKKVTGAKNVLSYIRAMLRQRSIRKRTF